MRNIGDNELFKRRGKKEEVEETPIFETEEFKKAIERAEKIRADPKVHIEPEPEDDYEEEDDYDQDPDEDEEYTGTGFDLTNLAVGIVVLGIVVSVGATILTQLSDAVGPDHPAVGNMTTGLDTVAGTFPNLLSIMFPMLAIFMVVGVMLSVLRLFRRASF